MAAIIRLPLGSSHAIQLFGNEKLTLDFVTNVTERILDALPSDFSDGIYDDTEFTAMDKTYSIPKAELTLVVSMLKSLWKQIAFNAMKKDILIAELSRLNFTDAKIQILTTLWTERGEAVLKRLRNISHSGTPRLNSVHWGIAIERATSYTPAKRDIKALLRLDTSDGTKFQKLEYNDLVKLHYTLQAVQSRMDTLIK